MSLFAGLLSGIASFLAKGASTCSFWGYHDEPKCPKSLL